MHSSVSRRHLLKLGAIAGFALSPASLLAVDPFKRGGSSRLQLSLAAYSFREYFEDSNHERKLQTDPAKRIDLFQFIDYCAEHRCSAAELTSYYFPKETDDAFLLKLRRHCFLRGVAVSGGSVGNTFTNPPGEKRDEQTRYVKQWVDHYAVLGAPHIRVFAGAAPRGVSKEEARKICVAALEECADYAGKRGIFLGIENHGGIVAEPDDLLEIIRTVKSPWVGINLDSANFHTDDPYRDFERCAPYAVNVQMKSEIQPRGSQKKTADLPRLVKILREANYQGYVALEYESDEDPWKAVPGILTEMAGLFANNGAWSNGHLVAADGSTRIEAGYPSRFASVQFLRRRFPFYCAHFAQCCEAIHTNSWLFVTGTSGAVSHPISNRRATAQCCFPTQTIAELKTVMKKLSQLLTLAGFVAVISFGAGNLAAQERTDRPDRQGRGNFDPEQMRQRMMERYREELEVKNDDEWKLIEARITKVSEARREIGFGGGMRFGGGRRGGDNNGGDQGGRRGPGGGTPSPEVESLQKAIEAKAPADELKAKLAKVREARKVKEANLAKARDELRKVLSVRQEASAVLMGLLQ